MIWAMLGTVSVELTDFVDAWDESRSVSYVQISRIDNKPLLQRMGDDLMTHSLAVRLNAATGSVDDKIAAFEKLKNDGKAFSFILANGKHIGDFILDKIDKSITSTEADGTLIAVDMTLSLIECPEHEEISYIATGECSPRRPDITDEMPPEPSPTTEG